jgi:hypothetical protein
VAIALISIGVTFGITLTTTTITSDRLFCKASAVLSDRLG